VWHNGEDQYLQKSVFKVNSSIPKEDWPYRRIKQYESERIQTVTVGTENVEVKFDRDCAYGLVAGQGNKKDEPECYAK
jgi:hypothetical protein